MTEASATSWFWISDEIGSLIEPHVYLKHTQVHCNTLYVVGSIAWVKKQYVGNEEHEWMYEEQEDQGRNKQTAKKNPYEACRTTYVWEKGEKSKVSIAENTSMIFFCISNFAHNTSITTQNVSILQPGNETQKSAASLQNCQLHLKRPLDKQNLFQPFVFSG